MKFDLEKTKYTILAFNDGIELLCFEVYLVACV